MYCAFQHSALYHCKVHLSCHFESFISASTSASVTRTVDLPLKNGHSTHALSLRSYFKLYFSPFCILFFPPSVFCMHIYRRTLSKSCVKMSSAARQDCTCKWKYDNFMHNLSSDIPSSLSVLLLSCSLCQRLKCLTLRVH